MKNYLAGAVAASSLFLAATSANAQDSVESQDFDRIEACMATIKRPSAVSMTGMPTPTIQVVLNGQSEKTECSLEMSGKQVGSETQNVSIGIFAKVANDTASVYALRNTDKDVAYDIQSNGAHYKATPIAGTDNHRIEISIPTARLVDENDVDYLKEEEAKGNVTVQAQGAMTNITVASGSVNDWFPEEITANTLSLLLGAFDVTQRVDQKELEAAAEKSVATSSTVWIPTRQP